jgi:hypothetical protein
MNSNLLFLYQIMTIKIPLRLLNIEGDGFHLQARVKINGKPALVIVDTGASRTVFDQTEIKKYLKSEEIAAHDRVSTGLGTNSMQSQVVTLGSFSLGKLKLASFPAVVLDLQHVNLTYDAIGFPAIAGVLGSDVLVANNAVIDFRKKELLLRQPKNKPKNKPKKKAVKKASGKSPVRKRKT